MRCWGLVGLLASACYAPTVPSGAPCTPGVTSCPSGQSCTASAGAFYCLSESPLVDGHVDTPGMPIDAPPGQACFGTGLVSNVCFPQAPTGTRTISANVRIDTATIGGSNCTMIVGQASGPSLCIVAAQTIDVHAGATLVATGPNPLVLIASGDLAVVGAIDVSSRQGMPIVGAGAQNACGGASTKGAMGNGTGGGGGGAGGSFGTAGKNGGAGYMNVTAGVAAATMNPTVLVGGCPGGDGGPGGGGGGVGKGGAGGGAVYLIGHTITITGTVVADGAGGDLGGAGMNSGGGGSGGGAGGLVGLDAPTITVSGSIFANGGGGGGGNGNAPTDNGGPGGESPAPTTPGAGGTAGPSGGGLGGLGYARGTLPLAGAPGTMMYSSGGGGGGGGGFVRVFGVSPSSLGGMISPPAS